jgi:hypothetical protein
MVNMIEKLRNYRPTNINFDIATDDVPENLGSFEKKEEILEFINDKFVGAMPENVTALRHIDEYEKTEIRKEYSEMLEVKIPYLKKDLQKLESEYREAKRRFEDCKKQVDATKTEIELMAVYVKRGTTEFKCDSDYTICIPANEKYYFYTWVDNQLKLCKIQDIPEHEKNNLFTSGNQNAERFDRIMYPEEFDDNDNLNDFENENQAANEKGSQD